MLLGNIRIEKGRLEMLLSDVYKGTLAEDDKGMFGNDEPCSRKSGVGGNCTVFHFQNLQIFLMLKMNAANNVGR